MGKVLTDKDIIDGILAREGGYVDNHADHGGPTNHGITLETLTVWNQRPTTIGELKNLSEDEARKIYETAYIARPGLWVIQDPLVRAILVDMSVNSGPKAAVILLQHVLGTVEPDGILGDKTKEALTKMNSKLLAQKIITARLKFYAHLVQKDRSQQQFAAGWMNRVAEFMEML